ncbi:MAG: hypothetical protein WBO77_02975 [Microgenomates group bacterium]
MKRLIYPYFTLLYLVLGSTLLAWVPFMRNFLTVYANYDGPLYIIVAKTFYDPSTIQSLQVGLNLNPEYFAAHLPLYPAFIAMVGPVTGYLRAMILVNVVFTIALAFLLHYVVKDFNLSRRPLLLTGVFLFLPRFLVVRSIGSPESLFMLLILGSLYLFEKNKLVLSGVLGALAVATKLPGILLFVAYGLVYAERYLSNREFNWRSMYTLIIPLGLLGVFGIYAGQYNDFFAYFHTNAVVPLVSPYAVFNQAAKWVGTIWLEDVIFYFGIYAATIVTLRHSIHRSFFYFAVTFFIATIFVEHRDIARYSLPLWPLAVIAGEKIITSKKFLLASLIILPAIYLYAWNFIGHNAAPIADWKPFL